MADILGILFHMPERVRQTQRDIPGIIRTMIETYEQSLDECSYDIEVEMQFGRDIYRSATLDDSHTCDSSYDEVWVRTDPVPQLTPVGVWIEAHFRLIGVTLSAIGQSLVYAVTGRVPRWVTEGKVSYAQ